jgi:predicted NACHT family NTPase
MNKFSHPKCDRKDQCAECGDFKRVFRKIQDILGKIREGSPLEQADAWIRDKHYAKDRLKIVRLSGDKLSMDQCYINLAIVEKPGRDVARSERSENEDTPSHSSRFSLSARLKIETPDNDIHVELQALFKPRKGPDGHTTQPRRILIRGRAGVGKTTLCKKMVHDFIRGTWKDLFDRVLWVPLRNLKTMENEPCNFEVLFHHEYFLRHPKGPDLLLARKLWHALETKGDRTLFILDGLDEVAQDLDPKSYKFEFFLELLNQPNVIITSRPHS